MDQIHFLFEGARRVVSKNPHLDGQLRTAGTAVAKHGAIVIPQPYARTIARTEVAWYLEPDASDRQFSYSGGLEMTAEEQRNLDLAQRYEDLYNNDIIKFIHECYTADCVVNDGLIRGYEQFIKVEESVLRAAPKRKMRVDHKFTDGNVVVVQAVLLDPDRGPKWQLPFCAVLTCRDGKIANDYTYAEFKKWPGSESW